MLPNLIVGMPILLIVRLTVARAVHPDGPPRRSARVGCPSRRRPSGPVRTARRIAGSAPWPRGRSARSTRRCVSKKPLLMVARAPEGGEAAPTSAATLPPSTNWLATARTHARVHSGHVLGRRRAARHRCHRGRSSRWRRPQRCASFPSFRSYMRTTGRSTPLPEKARAAAD